MEGRGGRNVKISVLKPGLSDRSDREPEGVAVRASYWTGYAISPLKPGRVSGARDSL